MSLSGWKSTPTTSGRLPFVTLSMWHTTSPTVDPFHVDDFEARRNPIDDVVETELSCYRSFRPTYKVLTSAHFSPERSDRTSVDDVQELETEAYARYGDVVERSEAV